MARDPTAPFPEPGDPVERVDPVDRVDRVDRATEAVAQALHLPAAPPGSVCRPCADCGVEWYLPPDRPRCPACAETVRRAEARQALLTWRREHPEALLARAGVPTRLRRELTADPRTDRSNDGASFTAADLQRLRDPRHPGLDLGAWRGRPWSVTLRGPHGVGKSTLAVRLAWRRLATEADLVEPFWVRAAVLVRRVLAKDPAVQRARRSDLLLLDDLGPDLHGPVPWSLIGEVLAERYDEERSTVITTNLSIERLARAHEATAERLLAGLICPVEGERRRPPEEMP